MNTKHNPFLRAMLAALGLILMAAPARAYDVPILAEATIQGGSVAASDVDEAAAGYLHLKYSANLVYARKNYFQFDLSNLPVNPDAPATFRVNFIAAYQQRAQLWTLNQDYLGCNAGITWNTAQANDLTSNVLRTNGPFTATRIGESVLIPTSGTTPSTFTIPRLGDVLLSNRVTLVLTAVDDPANNSAGLRMRRATAVLSVDLPAGYAPPSFSSISPQTLRAGESSVTVPFTLTDDLDPAGSLIPLAVSSDPAIIPPEDISFGGGGSNRTVTLKAGSRPGKATVTLHAVDSLSRTGSVSFIVTVISDNLPTDANRYDIYFAAGQSNMDGRGSTNDLVGSLAVWNLQQPNIRMYYANPMNLDWANPNYNTGWQVFGPGFSVPPGFAGALPSTRFGPELAFGCTIATETSGKTVAIIKVSQGGTTLSQDWKPATGYMYAALTNTARVALHALTSAGVSYTLRGMIWHQGESDGSSSTTTYQARLTEFINAIRTDLGVENLPFVVGELATNRSLTVRQAQMNVAATIPYVGFASSSNLVTLAADDPHFNSAGAIIMGQRMAAALKVPPIKLLSVSNSGGSLLMTGSGLARSSCRLLVSTNPALPLAQWQPASTNTLSRDGEVTFSVPLPPGTHARFFTLTGD